MKCNCHKPRPVKMFGAKSFWRSSCAVVRKEELSYCCLMLFSGRSWSCAVQVPEIVVGGSTCQTVGDLFHPVAGEAGQATQRGERVGIDTGGMEETPEIGKTDGTWQAFNQRHRVSNLNCAGLDDPKVPSAPACFLHGGRQTWRDKAMVELPARATGLTNLQDCGADGEAIADEHIGFVMLVGRKILPETAPQQLWRSLRKALSPGFIVMKSVLMHGLLGASVHTAVGLCISRKTLSADLDFAEDRELPNGAHLSLATQGARRTDLHANQRGRGGRRHGGNPARAKGRIVPAVR